MVFLGVGGNHGFLQEGFQNIGDGLKLENPAVDAFVQQHQMGFDDDAVHAEAHTVFQALGGGDHAR